MTFNNPLPCSIEELRSLHINEQVDIVCSAFEEVWKSGTQLDLRVCVSWVEPVYQKRLLHELMLVEKECREFHPPIVVEAANEFLDYDAKQVQGSTTENLALGTTSGESPSNQLPLYIDRFAITRFLGRGSFGEVYEAEDISIHRRVAVKVASKARNSQRTFAKEAENASKVEHPSIVKIYEVGNWRGMDYLVSELIEGELLSSFHQSAELDPIGCARVAAGIATAIAAAHENGVTHRDLKPSNVMIEIKDKALREGGDNRHVFVDPTFRFHRVRILDFGIAKIDGKVTRHTRQGDILGTPHYMSPEQAAGRADSVDGRSDIYSLGVILFEMLTGHLPFEGNESVVITSIRDLKAPRIRSLRPELPEMLDYIVSRCLEKNPKDRYQTATELGTELETWSDGRKPDSIALKERRRIVAGLASVVTVCSLIALSYLFIDRIPGLIPNSSSFGALFSSDTLSTIHARSIALETSLSRWVEQGNLSELANWLTNANTAENHSQFAEVDAWRMATDLTKAESRRVAFVLVGISDQSQSDTNTNDVLLTFLNDLELSQADSLGLFLQAAPGWMIGSFLSLPKMEIEDTKRIYLYRGLAQRLRANGDTDRLLDLLRLAESAELPVVLSSLIASVNESTNWQSKIREHFDAAKMNPRRSTAELDGVGRWKAKCALVAYGLGDMNVVDEVLSFSQTPQARSYFIYWVSKSGLPLDPLLDRMGQYQDDWRSTGVIATLSQVPKASLELAQRDSWIERLQLWYREHPSAGVHTGIRLLLKKWGYDDFVRDVDALPELRNIVKDRNWYMNSQGMQMSIVRGPVDLWFGNSPASKVPGSKRQIEYSFAYSDQVVSEVQYNRFRPDRFPRPKEQPAVGINFLDSVAYCDWLSSQENLATGESIKWLDDKKFELNFVNGGYRLPTCVEWECFTRVGTTTNFVFGEPSDEYAKWDASKHTNDLLYFGPSHTEVIQLNRIQWTSSNATLLQVDRVANGVFDISFHAFYLKGSMDRSTHIRLLPSTYGNERPTSKTEAVLSVFRSHF
jgi:serine/threonine protein kinase